MGASEAMRVSAELRSGKRHLGRLSVCELMDRFRCVLLPAGDKVDMKDPEDEVCQAERFAQGLVPRVVMGVCKPLALASSRNLQTKRTLLLFGNSEPSLMMPL